MIQLLVCIYRRKNTCSKASSVQNCRRVKDVIGNFSNADWSKLQTANDALCLVLVLLSRHNMFCNFIGLMCWWHEACERAKITNRAPQDKRRYGNRGKKVAAFIKENSAINSAKVGSTAAECLTQVFFPCKWTLTASFGLFLDTLDLGQRCQT